MSVPEDHIIHTHIDALVVEYGAAAVLEMLADAYNKHVSRPQDPTPPADENQKSRL